jgi:hypothetical protein
MYGGMMRPDGLRHISGLANLAALSAAMMYLTLYRLRYAVTGYEWALRCASVGISCVVHALASKERRAMGAHRSYRQRKYEFGKQRVAGSARRA